MSNAVQQETITCSLLWMSWWCWPQRICSNWVGLFVLLLSLSSHEQGHGVYRNFCSCLNFISNECSWSSSTSSSSPSSSSTTSHRNSSSSASLYVSVHCRWMHMCHLCTLNWLLSCPVGLLTSVETCVFSFELLCVKDDSCVGVVFTFCCQCLQFCNTSVRQCEMCLVTENVFKVLQKRADEFCKLSLSSWTVFKVWPKECLIWKMSLGHWEFGSENGV